MPEARLDHADLAHMVSQSDADLRTLAGARLLLTGGTGYIGRWLLEALCHANSEMGLGLHTTVLSRHPDRFVRDWPHLGADASVSMVQGDIRDFPFPEGPFSHVIHAATDVVADSTPLETFDVTVLGTRRVLEFCRERNVERVLLLSSGAVYGRLLPSVQHVTEDHAGAPRTDALGAAYGLGKMATEWLGTAYADIAGLHCSSARVFAQVGPYLALDKQFAAGNFIGNALRDEPFIIKGDGTPRRSYMYGTDLVTWLLAIMVRGAPNRAYNVGSDAAISIAELATAVATAAGVSRPDIRVQGRSVVGALPEFYVPSIARARDELGLQITVPFDEALRRTIAWYRHLQTGTQV